MKKKTKARFKNNMKTIPLLFHQIWNVLTLCQGHLCKEKYVFAICWSIYCKKAHIFTPHPPSENHPFASITTLKIFKRVRDADEHGRRQEERQRGYCRENNQNLFRSCLDNCWLKQNDLKVCEVEATCRSSFLSRWGLRKALSYLLSHSDINFSHRAPTFLLRSLLSLKKSQLTSSHVIKAESSKEKKGVNSCTICQFFTECTVLCDFIKQLLYLRRFSHVD